MNNCIQKFALLAFVVFGLIFMVVGTVICINVFSNDDKVQTTAIITDIESYHRSVNGKTRTSHKTHITYDVDGRAYQNVVGMYSSAWSIGDEIEIYYRKDDPSQVGSKDTDWGWLALPGIGVVFWAVGSIALLVSRKKSSALPVTDK